MDVLGDAVTRDRRSGAPALRHAASGRAYDYRRFCTTAWKVGNLLRNEGVRAGMDVAVAPDPAPETVLACYGAALLGATVDLGPDAVGDGTRALVVPERRLGDYDPGPRTRQVAYGAEPADPSVAYFERDVPSENPTEPPDDVSPAQPLLRADGETYGHAVVLDAAASVVERFDLDAGSTVSVRAPLTNPGAVAAGLVAPVLAGGEVLLPGGEATGAVAVGEGPEPAVVDPDDVLSPSRR